MDNTWYNDGDTVANFAFCMVMDDDTAAEMTVTDAEYNIAAWTEEGITLPDGMTAAALVQALHDVKDYFEKGGRDHV